MAAVVQPQKTVVPTDITQQAELLLRRKCACGASAGFAGECSECDDRRLQVQRRANGPAKASCATSVVKDVLEEEGAGLDEETRAFMESRFGHDFSSVRVHTDARAAESARSVNALAYTVGQHLVFARGYFQPQTQSGRHLIAHELTHTIQQGNSRPAPQTKLEVGEESDELEREADRIAERVMKGGLSGSAPPLQPPVPPQQPSSSLLVQRATASQGGSSSSAQSAEEAADASKPPTLSLIVEDDVDQLSPGQMRKSEFLDELRSSVCAAADAELARVGRDTESCPYITRAFDKYRTQSSSRLERSLRRYASEAAGATSARGYIEAVSTRVARAVGVWAETGELTDVPDELAAELSGGISIGGVKGLASMAEKAVGGLIGKAGKALSGLGRMLFKERAGGVRTERAEPAVIKSQLSEGETLDAGVRSRMERAFNHDFSRVRVYRDARAAELSASMNARAFTVGSDVGFGAGEYRPGTLSGDALIAHELAHVVQQGDAGSSPAAPLMKPEEGATSALEDDADVAAVGAVASIWGGVKHGLVKFSKQAMPRLKSGLQLQRCTYPQITEKGAVQHTGQIGTGADAGTVEVRTGETIDTGRASIENSIAVAYSGAKSAASKWLQFVWGELVGVKPQGNPLRSNDPLPIRGGKGSRALSPNPNAPIWGVDSGKADSPFYESGFAALRDSKSATIFDRPTMGEGLPEAMFKFDRTVTSVYYLAHFSTFLIQNNVAAYHVPWEARTNFKLVNEKAVADPVTYNVGSAGPVTGLPANLKQVLVSAYPDSSDVQ